MLARFRFNHNVVIKVFVLSSILIFLLLVFLSGTSNAAVPQSTPICGEITIDTTWTVAGSPYVICDSYLTILQDATLTIEPGVRLEFDYHSKLNVAGTLNARGSSTQPITFTSSNASPTPGSWQGIFVDGTDLQPAIAYLDWVTVEYAGFSTNAQVFLSHGTMTMTHSIVRFGSGYGVYVHYVQDDLNPQIMDSLFQENATYPIYVMAYDDLRFHNLSATGNGHDVIEIGIGSSISGDRTWQDAGIPYLFTGSISNMPGSSLTVEPGTEALFAANASLEINGTLTAVGLPDQPITFTAQTATPGFWDGISVWGNSTVTGKARFEYVTIEYGGSGPDGANLYIFGGQVQMRHSIVRHGGNDGIRIDDYGHSHTMIETSQIADNPSFGLENKQPDWAIMAVNNWWGDPSGPQLPPGSGCGPGGSGDMVSDGVIVQPVLASPTALPASPSADSLRMISINPLRWFVPATGVDRLYVEITLRDGKGVPLPGRTVGLGSTLGQVGDGGVTGFDGKTLAYVTSSTAGNAELNAIFVDSNACVMAFSPTSQVTFTPATADEGYLQDSQAPYLNTGIEMDPLPITQGVPTKLSISVTNPNDFPIIVDGSFYYVQNSIGLAFGPLAEVLGTQIPAKGQAVIQVIWVPPLSGKYCIRFEFTARSAEVGLLAAMHPMGAQRNLNVAPGPKHSPEVQNAYDTSRKAVSALGNASDGLTLATDPAGFIGGYIPGYLFGHIIDFWYDTMDKIDKALNDDPPRQDYTIISLPEAVSFIPLQAGTGVSQAKADAANARTAAALDMFANLRVAALANDRYGGANQAKKIQWASLQLGALLYYEKQAALQMPVLADAIDAYVAVVLQENPGDIIMTADIYQAYQERLQTQGFNSDELAAAHLLGMTDAEIEEMRQQYLALDPASVAGSVTQRLTAYAQTLRDLSYAILNPAGSVFISGSHGMAAQADTPNDHLARLFAMDTTILIGNPYTQTETVDLVIRPIDLPPDWLVTISPSSPSLAAGESITVTVHISAGSPAPQGTNPSFAVEGYIGSDLIGGTVIDTFVPFFTNFDGKLRIFMPLAQR